MPKVSHLGTVVQASIFSGSCHNVSILSLICRVLDSDTIKKKKKKIVSLTHLIKSV
jgi:hypothetical protein